MSDFITGSYSSKAEFDSEIRNIDLSILTMHHPIFENKLLGMLERIFRYCQDTQSRIIPQLFNTNMRNNLRYRLPELLTDLRIKSSIDPISSKRAGVLLGILTFEEFLEWTLTFRIPDIKSPDLVESKVRNFYNTYKEIRLKGNFLLGKDSYGQPSYLDRLGISSALPITEEYWITRGWSTLEASKIISGIQCYRSNRSPVSTSSNTELFDRLTNELNIQANYGVGNEKILELSDRFILVDFYYDKKVIEIDDYNHEWSSHTQYDLDRDTELMSLGIDTLRIHPDEFVKSPDEILNKCKNFLGFTL